MSKDSKDIEKRLQALLESPSSQESCWKKKFCKIIVVATFVLVALTCIASVELGYNWSVTYDDTIFYREKVHFDNSSWQRDIETEKVLKHELDEMIEAVAKAKKEVTNSETNIQQLTQKIQQLVTDIDSMKIKLDTVTKQRDSLKATHETLQKENTKLKAEVATLTKQIADEEVKIKAITRTLNIWKIVSGSSFVLTIVGAMHDIVSHMNTWRMEEKVVMERGYQKGFEKLTQNFEDYIFMSRSLAKYVNRKTCFHNGVRTNLTQCVGMSPTLTTITTTTGHRFSVFLNTRWTMDEGWHTDSNAFAMSDNHVTVMKINDGSKAFFVSKDNLMHFGSNDIIVHNSGRSGTARCNSFPPPHSGEEETCFNEQVDFHIHDIKVELLSIA